MTDKDVWKKNVDRMNDAKMPGRENCSAFLRYVYCL